VKAWLQLSGCLLLLAGCRQPNPDWEGPADADVGSTVDPDAGSSTSSPPADVSDAPEVMTEGERCQNDNQCPDPWVCGPMGCQLGGDGDPCDGDGDCQAVCNAQDVCQAGAAGDPCADSGDCVAPTGICGPEMVCQSGEAGQPCMTGNHCAAGLMCTDGLCA
jgi:hypothetical protein